MKADPSTDPVAYHGEGPVWPERWGGLRWVDMSFIDTDGTIAPTYGECKGGIALSYKGIWGYAPLIVSLANTGEALCLVNRLGNAVSLRSALAWNLKAWYGLPLPDRERGLELVGMEFRGSLQAIVWLPAQISCAAAGGSSTGRWATMRGSKTSLPCAKSLRRMALA
jgi:hypothetical protein